MRRVLHFFDYQADWWRTRASQRTARDSVLESGIHAYADKQATVREKLAEDFAAMWLQAIRDSNLPAPKTWPARYVNVTPSEKHIKLRMERNKLRKRVVEYTMPPPAVDEGTSIILEFSSSI